MKGSCPIEALLATSEATRPQTYARLALLTRLTLIRHGVSLKLQGVSAMIRNATISISDRWSRKVRLAENSGETQQAGYTHVSDIHADRRLPQMIILFLTDRVQAQRGEEEERVQVSVRKAVLHLDWQYAEVSMISFEIVYTSGV